MLILRSIFSSSVLKDLVLALLIGYSVVGKNHQVKLMFLFLGLQTITFHLLDFHHSALEKQKNRPSVTCGTPQKSAY